MSRLRSRHAADRLPIPSATDHYVDFTRPGAND
jgi:hypothetical protein